MIMKYFLTLPMLVMSTVASANSFMYNGTESKINNAYLNHRGVVLETDTNSQKCIIPTELLNDTNTSGLALAKILNAGLGFTEVLCVDPSDPLFPYATSGVSNNENIPYGIQIKL